MQRVLTGRTAAVWWMMVGGAVIWRPGLDPVITVELPDPGILRSVGCV